MIEKISRVSRVVVLLVAGLVLLWRGQVGTTVGDATVLGPLLCTMLALFLFLTAIAITSPDAEQR